MLIQIIQLVVCFAYCLMKLLSILKKSFIVLIKGKILYLSLNKVSLLLTLYLILILNQWFLILSFTTTKLFYLKI